MNCTAQSSEDGNDLKAPLARFNNYFERL